MSAARVVAVVPGSAADSVGIAEGDSIVALNGRPLRDVIEYRVATDDAEVSLSVERGGLAFDIDVEKPAGQPLGIEVDSAVFDRVRTCDNHCEFCFIYQLPKGMRRSLYLKDDDYRLSFLYGNFTTLTRFTEADLERVIDEGLSPLYVSIHATDPEVRSDMLKNARGAMSLRWLDALLGAGIVVHGQVVVCPGINDGPVLESTMCGILDRFSGLADVAVVPLGLSKYNTEPRMRLHTEAEAGAVVDLIEEWQTIFERHVGHRMVHAADEYYLLADRRFPDPAAYGSFALHEDGIGMVRAFEAEFEGIATEAIGTQSGFFDWVDGAPAAGYRSPRLDPGRRLSVRAAPDDRPVGVLTGTYGARVLGPLIERLGRPDVRVVAVPSDFFGGNVGVAGLMVGDDLARVLADQPVGDRYLLPDVCLSGGLFLDGMSPDDLPRPVEIVATDGISLREALR